LCCTAREYTPVDSNKWMRYLFHRCAH
jgi:hypothetical protein